MSARDTAPPAGVEAPAAQASSSVAGWEVASTPEQSRQGSLRPTSLTVPSAAREAPPRHDNCFDLLRLLLASSVIYSHAYYVGGFGEEAFVSVLGSRIIIGHLAVMGFFAISGYLIAQSYDRSSSLWSFATKRVLRIFPAFWGCLIVSAVAIGPLIHWANESAPGSYPWIEGEANALSYVINNSLLNIRQWEIGAIQEGLHHDESLNGSFWTLFPEMKCYIFGAFMGLSLSLRAGGRYKLLVMYAVLFSLQVMNELAAEGDYHGPTLLVLAERGRLVMLMQCFLGGMILYAFRDIVNLDRGTIFFALMMMAITLRFGGADLLVPVFMPLLVISIGLAFRFAVRHDISYGIYVYHFPIQVLLSCFAFPRMNVYLFMLLTLVPTLILATASWFLIERPALAWKPGKKRVAVPAEG